jgi:hypothetical protein
VGALLTLTPYRISINSNLLAENAEKLLAHAGSPQSLAEFLNWSSPPEILTAGFPPQPDARRLLVLMKENKLRRRLKARRQARGYADLVQPRAGFKGWWQRRVNDPKELKLACGGEVMEFLRHSPRLALLAALHDTLLAYVSAAEPRRVELTEVYTAVNPLTLMVASDDLAAASRLVVRAMSVPLAKVAPSFIIENIHGHVFGYEPKRNFAHYFA